MNDLIVKFARAERLGTLSLNGNSLTLNGSVTSTTAC
jgi:hypothetical protein